MYVSTGSRIFTLPHIGRPSTRRRGCRVAPIPRPIQSRSPRIYGRTRPRQDVPPDRSGGRRTNNVVPAGPGDRFRASVVPKAMSLCYDSGRPGAGTSRLSGLDLPGIHVLVVVLVELLPRDRPFGHRGKLDQEVHHLLFEDWRPHARHGGRIFSIIVPDFLLPARDLAGAFD